MVDRIWGIPRTTMKIARCWRWKFDDPGPRKDELRGFCLNHWFKRTGTCKNHGIVKDDPHLICLSMATYLANHRASCSQRFIGTIEDEWVKSVADLGHHATHPARALGPHIQRNQNPKNNWERPPLLRRWFCSWTCPILPEHKMLHVYMTHYFFHVYFHRSIQQCLQKYKGA